MYMLQYICFHQAFFPLAFQGITKHQKQPQATSWIHALMSAILIVKGPVCTARIIQKNGPQLLRNTNKTQFIAASTKLEQAGLGRMVLNLKGGKRQGAKGPAIFVKIHPDRTQHLRHVLTSYCRFEHYVSKYNLPLPSCINEETKRELVRLGLLSEKYV